MMTVILFLRVFMFKKKFTEVFMGEMIGYLEFALK